jgi:hypothetical protein
MSYIILEFRHVSTPTPLNAEVNPTCHLLALLGAHHILNVSRIRVKAPLSRECYHLRVEHKEDLTKYTLFEYFSWNSLLVCLTNKALLLLLILLLLLLLLLLLFNYALQHLKLIVRSGLDVPTFATRRHHARAPSGGMWNCGRKMSGNFA